MKKCIKIFLVVATTFALPLVTIASYTRTYAREAERRELIEFIEYCKTCENLRQVDPTKDYTKATFHELKNVARFYEEQNDFADCTDYPEQTEIDRIINK